MSGGTWGTFLVLTIPVTMLGYLGLLACGISAVWVFFLWGVIAGLVVPELKAWHDYNKERP